ncbi:cupin domain-containing protein [Nocardia sp. CNY236]|uniref:cupin domain-containing protein n=1 Tax=Nocardia sp. CNY236 TaxID=1169152 RepID=UPI00041A7960|nr:cupin domain-containing protein [Nocardia sp. CNY236]
MSNDSSRDRPEMSRRAALGTGAALGAGLAATAAACADATPGGLPNAGELDDNLSESAHLFHLDATEPLRFDGGDLRGAHENNFPVLAGQCGSAYVVRLEPGGIREPHWHPTAWELNYHISGRAKWTILGTHPDGRYRSEEFEARAGDLVFAPQGYFHYFENAHRDHPLEVLIVFNTSAQEPNDDIGLRGALNSIPRAVTAAVLGIPESALNGIPTDLQPVVITKRR